MAVCNWGGLVDQESDMIPNDLALAAACVRLPLWSLARDNGCPAVRRSLFRVVRQAPAGDGVALRRDRKPLPDACLDMGREWQGFEGARRRVHPTIGLPRRLG